RGSGASLPCARRPRLDAQVGAALLGVERLVAGADQHVAVGPRAVRAPQLLALVGGERAQPAAHAIFAPAVADEDATLDDERRHRSRFTGADIAGPVAPELLAARRVERDRLVVEGVEKDFAI